MEPQKIVWGVGWGLALGKHCEMALGFYHKVATLVSLSRARDAREREGAGRAQPGAAQGAGGAAEERWARPLGSTAGGALVSGRVRPPATLQVNINIL